MADELFDAARSSFLRAEDFDGCLVAYIATAEPETRSGDNGDYELVVGELLVIDGKPSEAAGITKLPELVEEFGVMGSWLVGQAKRTLKTGRPILGRMVAFKNKKRTTSYKIDEPTDDDLSKVTPAIRAELKAMIERAAPFDS